MYTIKYAFYIASRNMYLELRERKNLTFKDLKDTFNFLCYDSCSGKRIGIATEGEKIVYSNGDECAFQVFYNGKYCRKYSHGVK